MPIPMTKVPYISVHMDQDRSLIHSAWLRTVDSQEYRIALNYFIHFICMHKVSYWLADITQLSTPNMYDQKWTVELIGSLLQDSYLKKIAVVLKDDLFMEVVLERISEEVSRVSDRYVQIEVFNNPAHADKWLMASQDIEGLFREDIMNE
jgi:hypothetical protein